MKLTRYRIPAPSLPFGIRIAVASDLHGCPVEQLLSILRAERPNLILIPGDLTDDRGLASFAPEAFAFLRGCAAIAPTFYSLGNHEVGCYHKGNPFRKPVPIPVPETVREAIAKTGTVLLDNDCVRVGGLTVCGIGSGINGGKNEPDKDVLRWFDREPGYRILLCHHPEYYPEFIRQTGIELTVSGHAHGGQWRFFGQGIYSPGQGLFPRYTSGVIENRCIISRGLGNHTCIPRIFNEPELIIANLEP